MFRNTDAFVRSSNVIEADFGAEQRDRIPESLVAEVATVPGVADAQGEVSGFASIIGKDGEAIGSGATARRRSAPRTLSGELAPWNFVEGRSPTGPDEVAIDKASADNGDFAIGDPIQIASATAAREFTLAGIARFGDADSPGGATFALFDLATAQEFVGKPGFLDSIQVVGEARSPTTSWPPNIEEALGPDSDTEVLTGEEITEENQTRHRGGPAVLHASS